MAKRYSVVGADSLSSYTGTMTTTNLKLIGCYDTKEEVKKVVEEEWENNNELLLVVDNEKECEGEV